MRSHPLLSTKGKTTTDHGEIRRWAEARGGRPMVARGVAEDDPEHLRLVFPDTPDTPDLEPVSWAEWFRRFDAAGLALLCEELTSDGRRSCFCKLVPR
jgi:hypothetical protein